VPDHRLRAGVWGHYHGGNLGDDLVTSIVIEAVRRRRPDAEIVGFSLDPEDTRRRHGIAAFAITSQAGVGRRASAPRSGVARIARGLRRRAVRLLGEAPHLWRSYRALRDVDLLVVAGSGQLLDSWAGPWGHPYTTLKWAWLARLARTRLAFLSVGAGPLEGRLAARFVRAALGMAEYVSVRDESTAAVLRAAGVRRPLPVCPDMAFALDPARLPPRRGRSGAGGARRVGLNVMAHEDPRYWPRGKAGRYHGYVEKLGAFAQAARERGSLVLFSSQMAADRAPAQEVAALAGPPGAAPVVEVEDIDGLLETIASCDYVVAARFHCVILALLMGIPTIGLAYHPKTSDAMAMLGQGAYALDIDAFDAGTLLRRLEDLAAGAPSVAREISGRLPVLRRAVEEQFDLVFGPRRD
jgi:polysaccharide pyruvyl transferase WcaK-like protein